MFITTKHKFLIMLHLSVAEYDWSLCDLNILLEIIMYF